MFLCLREFEDASKVVTVKLLFSHVKCSYVISRYENFVLTFIGDILISVVVKTK